MNNSIINKGTFISKNTENTFTLLASIEKSGSECLCFTRSDIEKIKKKYGFNAHYVYLASSRRPPYETMNDLEQIEKKIKGFFCKEKDRTVMLDRMDYLINMHGFTKVIKFLYAINEYMAEKGTFIINVVPQVLSTQQFFMIQQEFSEFFGNMANTYDQLPDDLMEIMSYVKENRKVSFKDISAEFQITKTTARKRINNLHKLGIILIRKNGRSKIIELTGLGNRIICSMS
jgi:predicted transcriptional regulator